MELDESPHRGSGADDDDDDGDVAALLQIRRFKLPRTMGRYNLMDGHNGSFLAGSRSSMGSSDTRRSMMNNKPVSGYPMVAIRSKRSLLPLGSCEEGNSESFSRDNDFDMSFIDTRGSGIKSDGSVIISEVTMPSKNSSNVFSFDKVPRFTRNGAKSFSCFVFGWFGIPTVGIVLWILAVR